MNVCAGAFPFGAVRVGLYLEPVVVVCFVHFDVCDEGSELLFEAVFPLRVFGAGVDAEHGDLLKGLFNFCFHGLLKIIQLLKKKWFYKI